MFMGLFFEHSTCTSNRNNVGFWLCKLRALLIQIHRVLGAWLSTSATQGQLDVLSSFSLGQDAEQGAEEAHDPGGQAIA